MLLADDRPDPKNMNARNARFVASRCLVACVLLAGVAEAAVYKCTGADGKVAYQDSPCQPGASEKSIKVAPPPPASAASRPYVAPVPRSMYESAASPAIPKTIDAKGALETWDRFGK